MESAYSKFANGIVKSEYKTVMPVSELNFNSPNNYTVFKLDHGDSFYNSRIMYHIRGKVVKKSDGSDYADKSNIQLVDNFAAFLFSRVELKKHNTLIDSVDFPGITSTVKALLSYSEGQRKCLDGCGFVSKFVGGGRFEALGTLSHLGLGFFDHLRHPMFKGGFEITFTRAGDNDALLHWKADATSSEPADGKVVIESFVLRVPLVEYASTAKIQLVDALKHLSDKNNLVYHFYQWQCIDRKGVFGSTFSFDITGAYRNVYNPAFVIIALQTDRNNDQKKNPGQFDSCNVKNIAVKINGERYPQELQNLDINNKCYAVLYEQYLAFRSVNFKDNNVLLDMTQFIEKWPLFVIDTHLHPANTDRSRSDILVELDFTSPIDSPQANSGTTAYAVVVSETHFAYDITRNLIRFM